MNIVNETANYGHWRIKYPQKAVKTTNDSVILSL